MYEIHSSEKLTREIFLDPPARFRGAPFWAWNTTLDREELLWQIDRLKEMGFGGFFIHSRSGMATKYLSREFMDLVHACVDHAKEVGMLSNLYDEDRWASGAAGGYVTKHKPFRQRSIFLYRADPALMRLWFGAADRDMQLLAAFDIRFDASDRLESYRLLSENEEAEGEKWYVYTMLKPCSGWFNGYTYLDTMNPDAVDCFLNTTYEAYRREVGSEFGKNVPAIFTDEPYFGTVFMKAYARDGKEGEFPWTESFRETFLARFGYDIVSRLPELVWNLRDDAPSTARYHYYAHATELFASSYCDRIGRWCQQNGIAFTGHVLNEYSLQSQLTTVGEAMRQYREFTIPGIDMLCNGREFSTAKQAQSAVHQYGREGMTSELYGVTGWDFDFRGHKFQGDWQAALGVTLRVPHLAWVSMQGSAKRDYPASIGYQSAWFRKYGFIEDHFARVNTALTRGTPLVNVAVIHPIESAWMAYGVREHTSAAVNSMDARFQSLIQWLLREQIDFDFVSESLLPELYSADPQTFRVGKMQYRAVFVPPLVTIRSTTLKALTAFARQGGKVIVSGSVPLCVDGVPSGEARELFGLAERAAFSEHAILSALEDQREIAVYSQSGDRRRDLLCSMRQDGSDRWLFIAHCDPPDRTDGRDCACDRIRIVVKGLYRPTLYDTLNGSIREVPYAAKDGGTVITVPCYALDSFLFLLTPAAPGASLPVEPEDNPSEDTIPVPDLVAYRRREPNVLVLDQCAWSMDGEHYRPREEILRIDKAIRQELGYPLANGEDMQPWCLPNQEPSVFVFLRFSFESELEAPCALGCERLSAVWFNGQPVEIGQNGYFVDKSIRTMALPPMQKGTNELILRVPIGPRVSIENCFLIGDFGVRTVGALASVTELPERIGFGSVTGQGMPFYGAELTYRIPFSCEAGDLKVTADYYNGALISARLDGLDVGQIVLPPYTLTVPEVAKGDHLLELTLYATRINTFGALHLCAPMGWKGPNMWYTEGSSWAYEYQLIDVGILKKPVLTLSRKDPQ